jgi:hypothetical protein
MAGTQDKNVSFLPSQIDTPQSTDALTTTNSPFVLFCSDVVLVFENICYIFGIICPPILYGSGPLDELYPSARNLYAIVIHLVLFFFQSIFILSMPFFVFFVGAVWVTYCAIAAIFFYIICLSLNGTGQSGQRVYSHPSYLHGYDKKEDEVWLFVNGVAVG